MCSALFVPAEAWLTKETKEKKQKKRCERRVDIHRFACALFSFFATGGVLFGLSLKSLRDDCARNAFAPMGGQVNKK